MPASPLQMHPILQPTLFLDDMHPVVQEWCFLRKFGGGGGTNFPALEELKDLPIAEEGQGTSMGLMPSFQGYEIRTSGFLFIYLQFIFICLETSLYWEGKFKFEVFLLA